MAETYSKNEEMLRDELINKILIASAIVAITAYSTAQIRALDIGWTYRDLMQFLAVGVIVILALVRKKMKTHHKALFLIIAYSIGGFAGFFTLGMLAGTVFIFPTAAVVMAIFYSTRATLVYIGMSLLLCCIIAFRFCSGMTELTDRFYHLTTSYYHWFVYVACIAFFFAVAYVTIFNYRRTTGILVDKISRQRDELLKTNEELLEATKKIKTLKGLLPICASCKKIRDDKGYWNQIESYIEAHSEADLSHSLCPDCMKTLYPELHESLQSKKKE